MKMTNALTDWERNFLARKYERLIRMGEQARRMNEESRLDGANAADAAPGFHASHGTRSGCRPSGFNPISQGDK
jgi:hypothetical protein